MAITARPSKASKSAKSSHSVSAKVHQELKGSPPPYLRYRPRPRRGKRHGGGELSKFLTMPLDIVLEVFTYLLPLDLLRLARTTKLLRSVLMTKDSLPIWKACRRNVPTYRVASWVDDCPFPECPPDLSEPEYASLVFDRHCLSCGIRPACRLDTDTDMYSRSRECMACRDQNNKLQRPRQNWSGYDNFLHFCTKKGTLPFAEQDMRRIYKMTLVSPWNCWSITYAKYVYHQWVARKKQLSPTEFRQYLKLRVGMMDKVKQCSEGLVWWAKARRVLGPEEQHRIKDEKFVGMMDNLHLTGS